MLKPMWNPPGLRAEIIGKSVFEFYPRLRDALPQLSEMEFVTYKPEPKLSERLQHTLTAEEIELRDSATKICHGNGIPFWDALFGISMTRDHFVDRFIDAAFSHKGETPDRRFRVARDNISSEQISSMIRELPSTCGLVASSRVLTTEGNNEIAHIPMLDFRCPVSPGNAQALLRILTLLGHEHGVLAESGRSYHFYGIRLLAPNDWNQFMAKALLFAPVTDPRYIAHRLIDGQCRLKVTDSKDGTIPRISHVF